MRIGLIFILAHKILAVNIICWGASLVRTLARSRNLLGHFGRECPFLWGVVHKNQWVCLQNLLLIPIKHL